MFSRDDFEQSAGAVVRVAGNAGRFRPLVAQYQLARALSDHKRVIAILPTGVGKTLGAALPLATGQLAPSQMCFLTPMRTLVSAQAQTLREQIDAAAAERAMGLPAGGWTVGEQTGTVPEDPDFLTTATVATFDQALSSALRISYSASLRRRTINAGAVLGSYLVADEVHLFPRSEALTTLVCLLMHRPPELPFMLMTATLTRPVARGLAELLDAQVVDEPMCMQDREQLGLSARVRLVSWEPEPLTPQSILRHVLEHPGRRVLVVVNTVRRAIELAQAVEPVLGRERLCVLHSRFYREHRQHQEDRVRTLFGRQPVEQTQSTGGGVTIATQVVEVGLDISADLMLTELAPANSLVQRWGRSARWGGTAHIIVTPPQGPIYPYVREPGGEAVLERTRQWLEAACGANAVNMDDMVEADLLHAAHQADDEQWLHTLAAALAPRTFSMGETIARGLYERAGELIRHVETRTLLVHGDPDSLLSPLGLQGFALAPGTIAALIAGKETGATGSPALDEDDDIVSFELPADAEWRVKAPIWSTSESESERKADNAASWADVRASDVWKTPLMAVNPLLVSYDPFFGLSVGSTGVPVAPDYWARPAAPHAPSPQFTATRHRETLDQHVATMLRLYEHHPALGPRLHRIVGLVEKWCNWPSGTIDRLVRAAIVAHDAGKLSAAWQQGARAYQRAISRPIEPWIAHTDPANGARAPWHVPPHALSGAAHTVPVGEQLDAEIMGHISDMEVSPLPSSVLFTAVATHHSATLNNYLLSSDELLDAAGLQELNRLLDACGLPAVVTTVTTRNWVGFGVSQQELNLPASARELFVLALVTRMLRLADGWSQDPAQIQALRDIGS